MEWKTEAQKVRDLDPLRAQFMAQYLVGNGIDLGGAGYFGNVEPIVPGAVIVGLDYPGYDGKQLPFADGSQDFVFASHTLEHIQDDVAAITEWFRVIKPGGVLFITVPHKYLYERKLKVAHRSINYPCRSRWNEDHWRGYLPMSLACTVDTALEVNSFRVRSCRDVDTGYDYSLPITEHPVGCYEIEMIIEKLSNLPSWKVE